MGERWRDSPCPRCVGVLERRPWGERIRRELWADCTTFFAPRNPRQGVEREHKRSGC